MRALPLERTNERASTEETQVRSGFLFSNILAREKNDKLSGGHIKRSEEVPKIINDLQRLGPRGTCKETNPLKLIHIHFVLSSDW